MDRLIPTLIVVAVMAPLATGRETIQNTLTRLEFLTDGQSVQLTAIEDLATGDSLALLPGSGDWRIRFVPTQVAQLGSTPDADPTGTWLEVGPGGLVDCSETVGWSFQVTVDPPVTAVNPLQSTLRAGWSGQVVYDAPGLSTQTVPFSLALQWQLLDGDPAPYVTLQLDTSEHPPGGGPDQQGVGSVPLLYASFVRAPELHLASFGDPQEALVLPFLCGALVEDPTSRPQEFPLQLAAGPNRLFTMNLGAFYGRPDPADEAPLGLMLWDDDHGDHWKSLLVGLRANGTGQGPPGGVHVVLSVQHLPDDVYRPGDWVSPYAMRLQLMRGDWWDVARIYQQALIDAQVPWYTGPLSSPANPRPEFVKRLTAETYFLPGHRGDLLDLVGRQVLDASRVLGPGLHVVLYGGHSPGQFDAWLEDGPYLAPGRPSFSGARREVERTGGHRAAPYINGGALIDHEEAGICSPNAEQLDAFAAMLWTEDMQHAPFAQSAVALMCSAADWWFSWLIDEVETITGFLGARSVYLDYFLTGPCFDDRHMTGAVNHRPGGGNYMYRQRSEQLRQMRQRLDEGLPAGSPERVSISIEFLLGRWTDQVDIMHTDIEGVTIPTQGDPETPLANAVTIPLFRAVHDDVRLSRIIPAERVSRADRLAWIEATHVFTFGQITEVTRALYDLWPIFSDRFKYAPYYGFLQPADPDSYSISLSPGYPAEPAVASYDAARLDRYRAALILALRGYGPDDVFGVPPAAIDGLGQFIDGSSSLDTPELALPSQNGLWPWHSGHLRRTPESSVTVVSGSVTTDPATVPSVESDIHPEFETQPVFSEVGFVLGSTPPTSQEYLDSFLPMAMFQAPFDLAVPGLPDSVPQGQGDLPQLGAEPIPGLLGGAGAGTTTLGSHTLAPGTPPVSADAGSLAFVVTNPWIGRLEEDEQPAVFGITATFEPADYPGWSAQTRYSVRRLSVAGSDELLATGQQGPYTAEATLAPGEIVWWIFRAAQPAGR